MTSRNTIATTPSQALTYKANAVYNCGPQVDFAGAFASNYPTDLTYLLSTSAAVSSVAPYNLFRVWRSSIRVRVTQAGSTPASLVVLPSRSPSLLAMGYTQWTEQDYAKVKLIPAGQSAEPINITNSQTSMRFAGYNSIETLRGDPYAGGAGPSTDPARLWYWHTYVSAYDGTSNVTLVLEVEIDYDIEFYARNNGSTAAPT